MKPIRRGLCLLAALFLLGTALAACSMPSATDDGKLRLVTTCFPLYDFASQIVGDRAEVTLLLKPGEESHSYEPTPKDILAIRNCDLFLCIGGQSDRWVTTLIGGDDMKHLRVLSLIDCVTPLVSHEDEHEHEVGEETVTYDEHIWTSPTNAQAMVKAIRDAVIAIDPDNRSHYEERSVAYLAELTALDCALRTLVDRAERKTLLFGDRFPFLYFVNAYGLTYYAAFSGCSEESEVSAATIAFLIDKVRSESLPVVLITELSSGRIAESIAEATGATILSLHSCNNITADEAASGVTYLSLMQQNLTVLRTALGERSETT